MPLDIQIPYRGDQYLFQGISGGAAGLASGAEAMTKRFRQIQDAGKAADFYVKSDPSALMSMGVHEDEWKTLGSREKAAAVQGLMQKGAMDKLHAEMQNIASQSRERDAQAAYRQAQGEADEAMPRLMEGMMQSRTTMPGPGAPGPEVDPGAELMEGGALGGGGSPNVRTGAFSPEEIMSGIRNMGAAHPRVQAELLKRFMPQLTGQDEPMSFMEDPSTGQRFAVKGKQVLPSGINPTKRQGLIAQPLPDEQGNVVAHVYTDAKGKTTFLKPNGGALTEKDKATLKQRYIADHLNAMNARRTFGTDPVSKAMYDGEIKKIEDAMTALDGQDTATAAAKPGASASPLDLPKTAEELKKDQVYNTKRGPAKWDGKQFNLMK